MVGDNCPDFTKREDWFRIKCLVGLSNFAESKTKGIKDKTYTEAIAKAQTAVGFPSNKKLHIGRQSGSCDLEMDLDDADIRQLGNWDPSIHEKAYSTKVPIKGIRAAGGYSETGGVCFNVRTIAEPSEELLAAFEEFKFADEWLPKCLAYHSEDDTNDTCDTAIQVLTFVKKLRRITLQDAAFIMEFHPERATHPMFTSLSVFRTEAFKLFRQQVRATCEAAASENPMERQMESILPGVLQGLKANQAATEATHTSVNSGFRQMHERFGHVEQLIRNSHSDQITRTAAAFNAAAETLSPSDSVESPAEEAPTPARAAAPAAGFPGFNYQPNWSDTATARSVYNQWFGVANYVDKPVRGGLAEMEKTRKTQWRMPWCKGTRQKRFSRMKRIACDVVRLREKRGLSVDTAIALQERALKRIKYSKLADEIGKKDDEFLYQISEPVQTDANGRPITWV